MAAVPTLVVAITVSKTSPHIDVAQALCRKLTRHKGISAMVISTTVDFSGSRGWLTDRLAVIGSASVIIPFVDEAWLSAEENLLDYAMTLRRCIASGDRPVALPVVSAALITLATRWELGEVGDIGPCLERAVSTLPLFTSAFHLTTDQHADQLSLAVINFMNSIGFTVDVTSPSLATGASVAETYASLLATPSKPNRKPNSGLMRALHEQVAGSVMAKGVEFCDALRIPRLYIADAGTIALAPLLGMLPSLRLLDLSGNGVNNAGVAALCSQFKYHPSITSIDLSNNLISVQGAAELLLLLRGNRSIVELNVDNNFIDSAVWEARLQRELEVNRRLAQREQQRASATASTATPLLDAATPPSAALVSKWTVCLRYTPSTASSTLSVSATHVAPLAFVAATSSTPTPSPPSFSYDLAPVEVKNNEALSVVAGRYLTEVVPLASFTFTRANGKTLKFALEGGILEADQPPPPSIEGLASIALQWLHDHTDAAASLPAEYAAGVQLMTLRVELASGDLRNDFFVESEIVYQGMSNRVSKTVPQMFRAADITRNSGNLLDEVTALVRMLYAGDGTASSSAPSTMPSANANAADAEAVRAAEREVQSSLQTQKDGMATNVLTTGWGRPASAAKPHKTTPTTSGA